MHSLTRYLFTPEMVTAICKLIKSVMIILIHNPNSIPSLLVQAAYKANIIVKDSPARAMYAHRL